MNSGLRHSYSGVRNRQRFFENVNDFNLYVEDTGYEYWYKKIFNRMGFRLESVVASGNKNKLVEDYQKYGNTTNEKLNFYITDGDFWRYTSPEEMITDNSFIYLKTYNIESYFIDKKYSIQFLEGRLHTDEEGVVERGFEFENWRQRIVRESTMQFITYATIERMTYSLSATNPHFSQAIGKTVSKASQFLNRKTGFVDMDRWTQKYDEIMQIVDRYKLTAEFHKVMQEIKISYSSKNGEEYYNLICGKYLFTSLCAYIESILKSNSANSAINLKDFKWECINSFEINKLDYVKSIIVNQL